MSNPVFKYIAYSVLIGVFATALMDSISTILSSYNLIGNMSFAVFGRIVRGWLHGQLIYSSIADAASFPHEWIVGLITHYVIGSILAFVILIIANRSQINKFGLVILSLSYGLATVVLPWFILAPSVGFGFLGASAPEKALFFQTSLTNHFTYGVGLTIGCLFIFSTQRAPFKFRPKSPQEEDS